MGSEKPAVTCLIFNGFCLTLRSWFSRLQNEILNPFIGSCSVDLEAHTEFKSLIGQLGASLNRHDYVLNFRAAGILCPSQWILPRIKDNNILIITHPFAITWAIALPLGFIRAWWRCVSCCFNGHVFINQRCAKSFFETIESKFNALSRQAEVDSKPELEKFMLMMWRPAMDRPLVSWALMSYFTWPVRRSPKTQLFKCWVLDF